MAKTALYIGQILTLWVLLGCSGGSSSDGVNGGSDGTGGGNGASNKPTGDAGSSANEQPASPSKGSFSTLADLLDALVLLPDPTAQPLQTSACADCMLAEPEKATGEYSCAYQLNRETDVQSDDLVMLGPDDDLWPGNVLSGTAAADGELNAIAVPLGAITLSSTLSSGMNVALDDPSASTYRNALRTLTSGATEPTGSAVASKITIDAIYSQEDLSRVIGISASTPALLPISGSLQLEKRTERSVAYERVAVSFVQSYFKVSIDPHNSASEYFAPSVSADELQGVLEDGTSPVYVRSVTYGRRIVAVFEQESTRSSEMLKKQVEGAFPVLGSASAAIMTDQSAMSITASFRAIVLGDDKVFTEISQLLTYLADELPNVQTNWPIAYTLENVVDNSPFKTAITTEIVSRECESCGIEDPSETAAEGFASAVAYGMTLGDNDSNLWTRSGQVLLSADDVDWFKYQGIDNPLGVVDPAVTLRSDIAGIRLCIFADCESPPTTAVCVSGTPEMQGSLSGCCTTSSNVQLTGSSSGLCPQKTSDNATVYVLVDGSTIADQTCVGYDLTMHY